MLRASADPSGWNLAAPSPRVFLVDDCEPLRQALRTLLQEADLTVIGEAAGADTAAHLIPLAIAQTGPLVALIDVRMPGPHNGIDLTRYLRTAGLPVEAIVLTAFPEAAIERAAKNAGATAYLLKGTSPAAIVAAVHDAWTLANAPQEPEQ